MKHFLVINGPNLNLLGQREPDVYGNKTLKDLEKDIEHFASEHQVKVTCRQSNHEGEIIDWIQQAPAEYDGVVLNPGALTHYSYAVRDAIASITLPLVEVHISNIHAREAFREKSVIAPVVKGQIVGLGFQGYYLAIQFLIT